MDQNEIFTETGELRIYLHFLDVDKSVKCSISKQDSVRNIKKIIYDTFYIPTWYIKLTLDGHELNDNILLRDYDINQYNTICAFIKDTRYEKNDGSTRII